MTKPKSRRKPSALAATPTPALPLAAQFAIDPVATAIREARKNPLEPGAPRGNYIFEHETDPWLKAALIRATEPVDANLSPAEQEKEISRRFREIEDARAAKNGSMGASLRDRVLAAVNRCLTDEELAGALKLLLKDHLRSQVVQALSAVNTRRAHLAAIANAEDNARELAARNQKIMDEWPDLAREHGDRGVAAILARKHMLSPSTIRRIRAKHQSHSK